MTTAPIPPPTVDLEQAARQAVLAYRRFLTAKRRARRLSSQPNLKVCVQAAGAELDRALSTLAHRVGL